MCPGQISVQLQFSKMSPFADHGGAVRDVEATGAV
jgi:hypothetical protein